MEQHAPLTVIDELMQKSNNDLLTEYGIREDVGWESFITVTMNTIKVETMSFEANLRKTIKNELPLIEKKLKQLDRNGQYGSPEFIALNTRYNEILNTNTIAYFKGRKKLWIAEGEKVSKTFCGLEKANKVRKCISKLKKVVNNDTVHLTSPEEIGEEVFDFYSFLYANKDVDLDDITIDAYFFNNNGILTNDIPRLSPERKADLDKEITLTE